MKKKLVVWILTVSLTATNGCLVCAQEPVPDIPSEVQEYITNEADTQEDKNEPDTELIPSEEANMEGIILKNSEDGLLTNQPSPSEEYELASKSSNTNSRKSLTGNSISLDSSTITYSYTCRQIPCESLGGIYFLNNTVHFTPQIHINHLSYIPLTD